ncbi:integrase/recombinase XerC [Thermodesulfitimonas autotrophica]|uniref:Integrase/recombinase XerC n=1 Tax=Thermodesulfitimonas autotrophica TaxID=1894989 RepID=A0A3N5BPS2_9THEO|nr:tyrosine-type recombinase/integrase [Thermodesulfitimonas autotrophica]RPF49622.1 integrase/recombinase XerC [Thermodesulfitimonas autotrophica]
MGNADDCLTGFKLHLLGRGLATGTVKAYLTCLGCFASWWGRTTGEPFNPAAVTELDVADYRRHLQNRKRKPATVKLHLDVLSAFFTWACKSGLAQANPAEEVKRPAREAPPPRWLDRREVAALARSVQKHGTARDRALFTLLLHAGLRISEALSLKTQDIVIRDRSGHVKVRQGKGGTYREVPLNATARKILSEYMKDVSGGWLFPGRNGSSMTPRAAQKRLKELGRLAGVDVTPHKLRHTFCKMLVDAGESLDRVALLAGHASLDTTAVYTKPGRTDLEKAVEKLSWE